jgi:hypothetical protein
MAIPACPFRRIDLFIAMSYFTNSSISKLGARAVLCLTSEELEDISERAASLL